MELRVLKYFLAVAREQNITKAAEVLHISQPTLSTQLKELEEELGRQLLIRGSKGSRKVTLTPEGMLLKERAAELIRLAQRTEQEIAGAMDEVAGDIYIGSPESPSIRALTDLAADMRERYPEVYFHIESGNSSFILDKLDKGLLDFGIVGGELMSQYERFDYVRIPLEIKWGMILRKDHELSRKKKLTPKDIKNVPLIIPTDSNGSRIFSEWLGINEQDFHPAGTYNLLYNASLMVKSGMGLAFCWDGIVDTSTQSELCFRPISPGIATDMYIVWKPYKVRTRAVELFVRELLDRMKIEHQP